MHVTIGNLSNGDGNVDETIKTIKTVDIDMTQKCLDELCKLFKIYYLKEHLCETIP